MDKFHIYEVIGKGKHSEIFKGREKKRIDFVAIKRVDKAKMNEVINEVQIIHKLQSPHILKFHDWYETRHNLWLILEYCTGADLEALLKQDGYLPETSIKFFALDILSGLKYLHSLGIIHCDIRPRSFLIDEYGVLKFSKFTFARKISKVRLGDIKLEQRGFPPILAPEVFSSQGIHSYSSDFWAFGCTLYYLRQGFLPYGDDSVEFELIHQNHQNIAPLTNPIMKPVTNFSGHLADLVLWLLEYYPMNRCCWESICSHPFWEKHMLQSPTNLPINPAYEDLCKELELSRHQLMLDECRKDIGLTPIKNNLNDALPPKNSDFTPIRPKERRESNRHQKNMAENLLSSSTVLNNVETLKNNIKNPYCDNISDVKSGFNISDVTAIVDETKEPFVFEFSYRDLIFQVSDFHIRPIIGNRSIELIEKIPFNDYTLPFKAYSFEDISKKNLQDLESHLTLIYSSMHKLSSNLSNSNSYQSLMDINNILGYLYSISTLQEVANVVINTNFLNSLLKLLKVYSSEGMNSISSRAFSKLSPSPKAVTPTSINSFNITLSIKVNVSTIIATILRFATFVNPPSHQVSSDENLLNTIFSILKDSQKLDIKLKRRLIAAFGEMVFYIAAQDEEALLSGKSNRWTLPSQATVLLMKQVIEENDVVCKHYAAKTIENILAQGNISYKIQFVNIYLAFKLLEISSNGQNEHIQVTCAVAYSHLIRVVLFDKEKLSEDSLNKIEVTSNSSGFNNKRISNSANVNQKFVMKLFEKSTIESIIEMIKFSVPRIQAAFLNVLNVILWTKHDNFLKPYRSMIVSNTLFINLLLKLVEHGDNTIIKAKSHLCLQLICHIKPVLIENFNEKRFSNALVRIIETPVSTNNLSTTINNNGYNNLELSYQHNVALSMLKFLNYISFHSLQYILCYFSTLKNNSEYESKTSSTGFISPVSKANSNHTPTTRLSPKSKEKELSQTNKQSNSNLIGCNVIVNSISDSLIILKNSILLASHSLLRKYLFTSQYSIHLLILVSKCIIELKKLNDLDDTVQNKIVSMEIVTFTEEVIMMFMETLSLINFENNISSFLTLVDFTKPLIAVEESAIQYIETLFTLVLPSLLTSLIHKDQNHRVSVIAIVRRMLPSLLRLFLAIQKELSKHMLKSIKSMLQLFIENLPNLIVDVNPIPQYALKLIQDILLDFEKDIPDIVLNLLIHYNIINILIESIDANVKLIQKTGMISFDTNSVKTLRALLSFDLTCDNIVNSSLNQILVNAVNDIITSIILHNRINLENKNDHYDDIQINVVESLHEIISLILSVLSKVFQNSSNLSNYINSISPLLTILKLLLVILSGLSENEAVKYNEFNNLFIEVNKEMCDSLTEMILSVIGMILEIFPEYTISTLTNKESIIFSVDSRNNDYIVCESPRLILKKFLCLNNLSLPISLKVLKIFHSILTISSSYDIKGEIQEFINCEHIREVITDKRTFLRIDDTKEDNTITANSQSYLKLINNELYNILKLI